MSDIPNTKDGQPAFPGAGGSASDLYRKPTAEEIWQAIDDWMTDRRPSDPGEYALAKIWLRERRETITRCPGCDAECDEDCAITAEQHWAALNAQAGYPPGTPPWPEVQEVRDMVRPCNDKVSDGGPLTHD